MNNRPIGVFDSGVGGLTTVRELQKILPCEDIVYLGDTGRVPYGTRSRETIRKYAAQDIAFLLSKDVKAVVAACGTVSTVFGEQQFRELGSDMPYIDIVAPATRSACALSAKGRVGVIATPAAIRTGAYGKAVRAISPGTKVFGNACPLFVPLVENGMINRDDEITRMCAQMYLEPLVREEIDTLILGCTHYPLLIDIINDTLEYKVTLIDAGAVAAREAQVALLENDLLASRKTQGETSYYVTDSVEGFIEVAKIFLQQEITGSVTFVRIEQIDV